MSDIKIRLPQEVKALIHHVELNRAGWWDKAIQRLVLSAAWLSDSRAPVAKLQEVLKNEFCLSLNQQKLHSALSVLCKEGMLVELQDGSFRIPDEQRGRFEQSIADVDRIEALAKERFRDLVELHCPSLPPHDVWIAFETRLLTPLIKDAGAGIYNLIAGDALSLDPSLANDFVSVFGPEHNTDLKGLVTNFLDPKHSVVRSYISRMLHAYFCVQASGLPEATINRLNEIVGKCIQFKVFVDTNFLFSILALHDNPSNDTARELKELISQLKDNPKIELYVSPRTIQEAKASISAAKSRLAGYPSGANFAKAGIHGGLSGMDRRFLEERLKRGGSLTAEDWFDPFLKDFIQIAKNSGVSLYNEKIDAYATRQDVVDDIMYLRQLEDQRASERQKNYAQIEHDMMLWHFVHDKRPAYAESPMDVQDWILTVDFRFIRFDEKKRKHGGSRVPICIHPTMLIQLLQFWIPRTSEFEEAILGSMRLPFLFQEFDVNAEKTSLSIIKGLGRFEGNDQFSEATITHVVLNDGLRARIETATNVEEETTLIRDVLVDEFKAIAKTEAERAKALENSNKEQQEVLEKLAIEKQSNSNEIEELRRKISTGRAEIESANVKIDKLNFQISALADREKELTQLTNRLMDTQARTDARNSLIVYLVGLLFIVLLSTVSVFGMFYNLKDSQAQIWTYSAAALSGVLCFIAGHLLLEQIGRWMPALHKLWPFQQISLFRKWLWGVLVVGIVLGVGINLYSNAIQAEIKGSGSNVIDQPK